MAVQTFTMRYVIEERLMALLKSLYPNGGYTVSVSTEYKVLFLLAIEFFFVWAFPGGSGTTSTFGCNHGLLVSRQSAISQSVTMTIRHSVSASVSLSDSQRQTNEADSGSSGDSCLSYLTYGAVR